MSYSRSQINNNVFEERNGRLYLNGDEIIDGNVRVKASNYLSVGLIIGFGLGGFVGWFIASLSYGSIG